MKNFLPLVLAVVALPFFQSCVGPGYSGVSYGSATNYGSSAGTSSPPLIPDGDTTPTTAPTTIILWVSITT